jgi:hypothetical protein
METEIKPKEGRTVQAEGTALCANDSALTGDGVWVVKVEYKEDSK